jgi:hypothetical protein
MMESRLQWKVKLISCCNIACSQGPITQHTGPASLPLCRWWEALSVGQRNDSAPMRGHFAPDVNVDSRRAEPASSGGQGTPVVF